MSIFSTIGKIAGGIGGFLLGGPAGAAAGSSLLGGIGGAIDGNKQTKNTQTATNNAVNAINTGYQSGINAGNAQQAQTAANLAPWLLAGQSAIGQQGDLVGLNGAAQQQTAIDARKASPLYQSLYNNGQNAILANASATGGLRGGNTQRSLYGLGNDTLAAVIQQQLGNLGSISTLGAQTGSDIGRWGAANTASIQSLLGGIGSANASGILSNQAASNANSNYNSDIMNGLFGQGGAGFDLIGSLLGGGGSSTGSGFTSNDMTGWMDGYF